MRIRFDAARFEPFTWKETIEVAPEELEGLDLLAIGAIDCRGTLSFSDPEYLLQGRLEYEQTVACNRCLKPVVQQVQAEMDLALAQVAKPRESAGEIELSESDLGVMEVPGEMFDTRPLVLEQVALGVPMKPLCREDCRGLCPVCGVDRNETACDCETSVIDPRWAALAALKDALPGGKPGAS